MRWIIYSFLAVIIAGVGVWHFASETIALRLMARVLETNLSAPPFAERLEDGLHIGVCGAGGPLPDPKRGPPCLFVIAGKQMILVDAGSNSARQLGLMRVGGTTLDAVILTHFHSDHIGGLGDVMINRWAGGDFKTPLPVYGPPGVKEITAGFNMAYRQDSIYRNAHHGDAVTPLSAAGFAPVEFEYPANNDALVEVWNKDGLVVKAFRVDHAPVSPAIGLRFDYGGRSIVISGDTTKETALVRHAKGADILFHEGLSFELVGLIEQSAKNANNSRLAKIAFDIPDYHTNPPEAAAIAAEAGVKRLVFYHIVPPLLLGALEDVFLRGTEERFDGEIILSVDGMFFSLPANSDEIELDYLP